MESHETGFPPSTLFGNPFGIPTFPGLDDGIYVFSALSARTIRHRKGLVTDVSGPQRNVCPGTLNYKIPHSIRVDRTGNIWTVDAASSTVIKYSPRGRKLVTINVGGQPDNGSPFNGTTDIAFGPTGRLFITDGYGNARILEYSAKGRKMKEWGRRGAGPGEFSLPHAIQIDEKGTIYVADRENGRIEKFDIDGNFLGEIPHLGRIYSLKLAGGVLWAGMEPFNEDPGAGSGWVVKLDRNTGDMLGHLDVPQGRSGHSIELMPSGEPLITSGNELLWFKAN